MKKLFEKWGGFRTLLAFDNAAQLIINRLIFPGTGPTVYRLGNLEVLVDHSVGDHNGTRSCLVPGLYDPCFEIMTELGRDVSVLDLGANGGGFLIALQHRGMTIKTAVAVELNPHTHSRLSLNLLRNIPHCHQRVKILNGAAGAEDGTIEVELGRGSVGDSIHEPSPGGERFLLPSFSLDTLCRNFPDGTDVDICKIDIEGSEHALIERARLHLLRRFRHIIIEIHDIPSHDSNKTIDKLIASGFSKVRHHRKLPEATVHHFARTSIKTP